MDNKCLLLTIIFGLTVAQTEVPDALQPLTLPPEVIQQIEKDEALKNPNLTSIERKCIESGGTKAYSAAKNASINIHKCLSNIVDYNVLQNEIQESKLNGNLSKVFAKYCQDEPRLRFKVCFHEMLDALKHCFPTEQKGTYAPLHVVVDQFTNVTCNKDGESIALFFAEGGQECWKDRQSNIERCVNDKLGIGVNLQVDNLLANLSKLTFDESNCHQIQGVQKCVRTEFEHCRQGQTVAAIVDKMFEDVLMGTSCDKYYVRSVPDSADVLKVTLLTSVMAAFTFLAY